MSITKPGEPPKVTVTAPVVDGENIPDVTNKVARQGSTRDIPVIIGNNRDEWKLFGLMQPGIAQMDETKIAERLATMILPEQVPAVIEGHRKTSEKNGINPIVQELLSAIHTNIMFRVPATELIEARRDNGQRAYFYLFNWVSPVMGGMLGACYALEISFIFGTYNNKFCRSGPEADQLSHCMQDAWLAFAYSGDPSCDGLGKWPVYGNNRATMILGKDCHVEEAPLEEERQVWANVKRLETMP